ncbi:hypothetical protein QZM26_19930 [Burkholderia multivorans]|uniref:hypothetical protein n=1 Tax=Burkholderia multivorans TaxID=87883 RepID=UPI0012FE7301|nr:hypothetical protein [Burkholderia multivorans]MBU9473916.1 hypothetical protein [Burkholderia multivorans]MDN7871681.1 hypothetical protein [Burkholderia multivorans]
MSRHADYRNSGSIAQNHLNKTRREPSVALYLRTKELQGIPVGSKRDDRKQDGLTGHNALLSALKAAQTECEFILAQTGAVIVGQVAHFDEETISVAGRRGAPEVLFKHALRSFRPLHERRDA